MCKRAVRRLPKGRTYHEYPNRSHLGLGSMMNLRNICVTSLRARVTLSAAAFALYFLGFLLIPPQAKATAPILSILPIVAVGWTLGLRAGLLAVLVSIPLNTIMLNLSGRPGWDALFSSEGGLLGTLGLAIVGAAIGRLTDLRVKLEKEVSQRKRAEQVLRETEDKYRIMVEGSLAGVYIFHTGKFRYVNEALADIFGYARTDIVDRMGPVDLIHPDNHALYHAQRQGLNPSEFKELHHRTFHGIRKDGSSIHCELIGGPVELQGRRAVVGTLIDVSERRRIEQAEKEFTQMKNELILGASHGLRTPLHTLKGFLEMLRMGKVDDPRLKEEFIARAAIDADRLSNMVENLLDMAQLESGDLKLAMEEVDLKLLCCELLQTMEHIAEVKGVTVTHMLSSQPLIVTANRIRIRQVMANLLDNAIRFSKPGGTVVLTGDTLMDGTVSIRVSDQGIGIPKGELPKVFDKFYGVGTNVRHAGGGAGLGLYISKRIIEAHGGHINVESEPEEGSTFYFSIPV